MKELNQYRSKVKKLFMGFAFGDVTYLRKGIVYDVFNNKFPNVVTLFEYLKLLFIFIYANTDDKDLLDLRYTSKKKSLFKAGNDHLSIGLQRLESSIFIDRILTRLQNENLTVITKHDAILCKKSEEQEVRKIMKEELDAVLGMDNYVLDRKLLIPNSVVNIEMSSHENAA